MAGTGRPRTTVVRTVDFGTAELVPDPARAAGWTVQLDGVAQSYVDLDDPTYLRFPYVRRLAAAVDAAAPRGVPLRVLHLGGGGLTLPRYVAATRPGSVQQVVEHDAALLELVSSWLPWPPGDGVAVRVGDARAAVVAAPPRAVDLVVADVFAGAHMPASVASVEFARAVSASLRPGGWYAVNLTDLPPLAFSRTQVATLRAVFPQVCLLGETGMLRGRRYGNLVLVAATAAGGLPVARLAAAAARDPAGGALLHGAGLTEFAAGARPFVESGG